MKAKELLAVSAALMGEKNDTDSGYDLQLFEENAPRLINVLLQECFELDCSLKQLNPEGFNYAASSIDSLEDELDMHESIVKGILPFGLCYLFLINEDMQRAQEFKSRYLKNKERLKNSRSRGKRHGTVDVYR